MTKSISSRWIKTVHNRMTLCGEKSAEHWYQGWASWMRLSAADAEIKRTQNDRCNSRIEISTKNGIKCWNPRHTTEERLSMENAAGTGKKHLRKYWQQILTLQFYTCARERNLWSLDNSGLNEHCCTSITTRIAVSCFNWTILIGDGKSGSRRVSHMKIGTFVKTALFSSRAFPSDCQPSIVDMRTD